MPPVPVLRNSVKIEQLFLEFTQKEILFTFYTVHFIFENIEF